MVFIIVYKTNGLYKWIRCIVYVSKKIVKVLDVIIYNNSSSYISNQKISFSYPRSH